MDTVVKSMLEEEEPEGKKMELFGRDLAKIPCFRESFLCGIGSGIGMGLGAFIKTSKPLLSQHVGFGTFMVTTLVYYSVCRYQWSQQKFNAMLLKQAMREKVINEGTLMEKELEAKGVLESV